MESIDKRLDKLIINGGRSGDIRSDEDINRRFSCISDKEKEEI